MQKRGVLETTAYLAIIIGVLAFLGSTVLEHVLAAGAAAAAARGDSAADKMLTQAVTNAMAAHVTFTNMQGFTMHSCFKGIVVNKWSGEKVESIVVCSGDVKPHSTVTVEAPYSPGEVERICRDENSRFGGVSWERCDFTTVEVKK
jgi:hypothetical protein